MTQRVRRGMVSAVRIARVLLVGVVLSTFLSLAGCAGGTETGNPSFEAKLSYTAYSSRPLDFSVREPASVASVDAAWLTLADVRFLAKESCTAGEPHALVAPGLGVGNHASGNPVSTEFELEGGAYCAVEVPFALAAANGLPPEAPAELRNSSIVIQGALQDGTAFTIRSRKTASFRLSADGGGFDMGDANAMTATLIGFDVATWLGGIDWAKAAITNGSIEISPDVNGTLLDSFESVLGQGIVLYRDRDSDGLLDATPVRLAHVP